MAKKQKDLPGMERKRIKEIDTAAEDLHAKNKKYAKAGEAVKTSKQALIAAMKKHGVEVYKDESVTPALVVNVTLGKENVKVKQEGAEDDDEDEDDGDEPEAKA